MPDLILALVWLTRLPVGRWLPANPPPLARAAWAFPLVGLVLGLAASGVFAGVIWLGLGQVLAAILAVATLIWLSGGLHEDGLADLADGMGGQSREQRLEIMRDSRIGSYGALTLGLVMALRITALSQIPITAAIAALLAIAALSRAGMVVAMASLPPARRDGLGQAAGRPLPLSVAMALILGISACAAASFFGFWPGYGVAVAVVLACLLAQAFVQILALRKLGGLTGDVLGAVQQAGETAALLALTAAFAEKL